MQNNKLTLILSLTTISCGLEANTHESALDIAVATCADCVDPAPVTGTASTGGGAGVGTSSTAAAADAKTNAQNSACKAAKHGLTPPPCPDATNCTATSTITCTYSNMQCPNVGTFGGSPGEWVAACRLSNEPAAWKAANCNRRTGPAGKPSFVLCSVDATATASTDCEPNRKVCEGGEEVPIYDTSHGELRQADCTAGHCDPVSDTKPGSGRGSAISDTSTGAASIANTNASTDAKLNAASQLKIPDCAAGCVPFGAPTITYTAVPGPVPSCPFTGRFDTSPDEDFDGLGDNWERACSGQANHSIHDDCTSHTTAGAKPFFAWCYANAIATGTQLCVDKNSTCAMSVATAEATNAASYADHRSTEP